MFTTASAFEAGNLKIKSIDSKQLIVSPNPAKNYFVINYKNDVQQKINAVLYDANGKTVWSSGLINAQSLNGKQVNTSQFAKGVFYLKLINENGELIASAKIVVAN